tara:strand:- start:73 stop:237 length:165 start_codon:yes stop_codon:yes gene_type:complete
MPKHYNSNYINNGNKIIIINIPNKIRLEKLEILLTVFSTCNGCELEENLAKKEK